MDDEVFFNAHHAPIGAHASFTLGFQGASGGLDLERGSPSRQDIYIGLQSTHGGTFDALPFFDAAAYVPRRRNPDLRAHGRAEQRERTVLPFPGEAIARACRAGTDTWRAGGMVFRILSPVRPIPEPGRVPDAALRDVLVPAVFAELRVDARDWEAPRRAFFGYRGSDPHSAMRRLDDTTDGRIAGVGQGRHTAIISCDGRARSALAFSMEDLLSERMEQNWAFGLGECGALIVDAPPGEISTYRFAICFHRGGLVTTGIDASYYYTRFFATIEEVAAFAYEHHGRLAAACLADDAELDNAALSGDQRFMLIQAIRSYYANTELLARGDRPFWIVNEGDARMINTLDLAVDQLFYEMRMNPWTVRNVLDMYLERFSYHDRVRFPGEAAEHAGGLAFTHDMGVANSLSRPGYSAIELAGLDGCFSYMTHEQLTNWACCATVYARRTDDTAWVAARLGTLRECLESMRHRDHPDADHRDGIMDLDSARASGGTEITTYDSEGPTLAQARGNAYLAGKCWAAYVGLEAVFRAHGLLALAAQAGDQADRCAATLARQADGAGHIPAILGGDENIVALPVVEGLVFPYVAGCAEALDPTGRFGPYLLAARRHIDAALVRGLCLSPDGSWRLSSARPTTWLSKVYLWQFIAYHILDLPADGRAIADAAHARWLTNGRNAHWCWSDQFCAGELVGSRCYPRGVTAILWLDEHIDVRPPIPLASP